MKVLVISHTYIVEENRKKLYELSKFGLKVILITPDKWVNKDLNQTIIFRKGRIIKNFYVYSVKTYFNKYISLIFYSPWHVLKIIKECKPDIIHLEEEPWSLSALEFMILSKIFRAKLILFTWENLDRKFFFIFKIIRRLVLKNADYIICGNHDAVKIIKKYGYKKNYAVIPQLGVDEKRFNYKKYTLKKNFFVIGFVGRFVFQKGILNLLHAFKLLSEKYKKIKLVMIGTGPLEKEIAEFAKNNNLTEKIFLKKDIPHENIPQEMNKLDILVLPSITTTFWKEQFGHVLIEAMSCGIPVVGSNSGEIPNIIGDAGLVFNEHSINEMVEKIELLMKNENLYRKLKIAGRKKVLKFYTNKVIAEKTFGIYRDLLI